MCGLVLNMASRSCAGLTKCYKSVACLAEVTGRRLHATCTCGRSHPPPPPDVALVIRAASRLAYRCVLSLCPTSLVSLLYGQPKDSPQAIP